ncbi:uncharacterized protein A1O9_02400 [Exophiala aquamarina CBS 119918]|uniref:SMODS and SLOG-associating 2TM effector domain-containing protein n=1 Tax=Exophiala aquamarina CBS 119918 TaxID=1182545 RepID=A0A072PNE7_9EURO|nr:uncharacterized protein A1O9_02400 [Exophiala aquamarina CBS 119918]KEF60838.1 hypothetical protein A1O9_02400 [Exophiala aquamarina CBS 119918]
MDDTRPRTTRPAQNASSEQIAGAAPIVSPESERRAQMIEGEAARHDGNTDADSRAPSPIVRVPGQDGGQAQRQPAGTSGSAVAGQGSNGGQKSPPVLENKEEMFKTIVGKGGYENFNHKVRRAHQLHTYQYWFVATTSNALLFIQVVLGASLTVLGAFNDRRARTATIFLGAANTVIAALLTYFKTRNQPNRARQLRNDLGRVVDQLDDAEANFRTANVPEDVTATIQSIRTAFKQARADAESNYPDLWVKAGDVRNPFNPDQEKDATPPEPLAQPSQPGQQNPGSEVFASGALGGPPLSSKTGTVPQATG